VPPPQQTVERAATTYKAPKADEAAAVKDEGAAVKESVSAKVESVAVKDESVAVRDEVAAAEAAVKDEGVAVKDEAAAEDEGRVADEKVVAQPEPLSAEALEWARLLTGVESLGISDSDGAEVAHEEVCAALASWVGGWKQSGLRQKFELLPDWCLTTRVWKVEADVRKSFGRAAAVIEAALAGKGTLASALRHVEEFFGHSRERLARSKTLRALSRASPSASTCARTSRPPRRRALMRWRPRGESF
jgi:hypothetical protein